MDAHKFLSLGQVCHGTPFQRGSQNQKIMSYNLQLSFPRANPSVELLPTDALLVMLMKSESHQRQL